MEIIGWIGSLLLAVCALPQAILSYRQKHSEGISHGMLFLWGLGELFVLAYVVWKMDLPLIVNYGANLIMILIIGYYKYFPTQNDS